jgi:hypothetical protein
MTIRRESTEPLEAVRTRLYAEFPDRTAEVTRQIDLAIACAEHLGIRVTPQLLENLVTEQLQAKAASRPTAFRTPAVPLVCRGPRAGAGETPAAGARRCPRDIGMGEA